MKRMSAELKESVWNVVFQSDPSDPITPGEFNRLLRAITVAHREYLRELRLSYHQKTAMIPDPAELVANPFRS